MTLNRIALIFFMFVVLSFSAGAAYADNSKKAKALYFAAEDAYAAKKYDDALIGIKTVERLLGKSNALLQGLRVKSLFGKGDYTGTQKALDKFFKMDASDTLNREIAPYLIKLEKKIEARKIARAAATRAAAVAAKRAAKKKAAAKAKFDALKKTGLIELTFGGPKSDYANDIAAMPGGGLVVVGEKKFKARIGSHAWIIRLDEQGTVKWEKKIGREGYNKAVRVLSLLDNSMIVAGESTVRQKNSAWVARINADGRQLWKKNLPAARSHYVKSLAAAPRRGFVVAATKVVRRNVAAGQILRYDRRGELIWKRYFSETKQYYSRYINDIKAAPGGGFVFMGSQRFKNKRGKAGWVARLDSNGQTQWERSFVALGISKVFGSSANGFTILSDGGFTVAGSTNVDPPKNQQAWVFRLDRDGKMLWEKTFGGNNADYAHRVVMFANGKFIVIGTTNNNKGNTDTWLLSLGADGQPIGEKSFGGPKRDAARRIAILPSGWFALAGMTESKGAGRSDAWVVLTCGLAC